MPTTKTTARAKKPAAATPGRPRATSTRSRSRRRRPTHGEISERAYFIYLEGGTDEFGNWLRAERELMAA